ncbi:MlaD family protein [Nocardia otitidiscaviarum]|uniref:MlaD family protein n=1 Tax=Nocardia otitidiscaviarum TaxID=1823 RepID=UPI001893CFFB|nr:MlaD family protein [Nocardia otitidiscaviarum]MBF6180079.1 MCE family protein [Nocardia otitidiscaviarum]
MSRTGISRGTVRALGIGAAVVIGMSGCGVDPSAIPVPGGTIGGPTYRIDVQFANALNLPARAEVMADGVRVGNLVDVMLVDAGPEHPGYVVAQLDIATSVRLAADITAQLRQDTVLGDVYIALTTPADSAATPLADGATIGLDHTRPALQVEDMMAGVATFVRGGAITRMQDIVARINAALPDDPGDTARMAEIVAADLTDLAAHLDVVSEFGAAARADIDAVRDNTAALRELFSADGARQVTGATASLAHLMGVFDAIGDLSHAVAWLAPLARSGDAAAAALLPLLFTDRPLDLGAPSNLRRFSDLLHDRILPFVERGPKVDISDVRVSPAAEHVSREERQRALTEMLRMVGVIR